MSTFNGKEPKKTAVNRGPDGKFLPGNNANPKGRPVLANCLTTRLREKLKDPCPYAPDKTWLEYLVDRWLAQSVENSGYFRELIERLEGKVVQPIGGEGGGPILIREVEVRLKEG